MIYDHHGVEDLDSWFIFTTSSRYLSLPAPSIDIECRVLERRVTRDLRAWSVTNFAANTIRLLLKRKRFKRFRLEYRWLEKVAFKRRISRFVSKADTFFFFFFHSARMTHDKIFIIRNCFTDNRWNTARWIRYDKRGKRYARRRKNLVRYSENDTSMEYIYI